jgi:hypothetical protein
MTVHMDKLIAVVDEYRHQKPPHERGTATPEVKVPVASGVR